MKLKFLSILMVVMFLTAGLYAQKQVNTAEALTKKVEMQKKANNQESYVKVATKPYVPSTSKGVLLDEGFENPLVDWTFYQLGDLTATWTQTTNQAHSGSNSYYHDDANSPTVAYQNWMVTPALVIDADNYNLSFWEYQNWDSYYTLHRVVVLDGADPSTATELGELYSAVGTEDTWVEQVFSLAAYNGQTIYIGFYYEGDFSDEWFIDDVMVSSPTANDLGVLDITPDRIFAGDTYTPSVTILNPGVNDQDAYSVTLYDNTGNYSETINVSLLIASGDTYTVTGFQWDDVPAGTYTLTAVVTLAGDEYNVNDMMAINFIAEEFENYNETTIYAFDASDWTGSGFGNHIVGVDPVDATMSDVGASGVSGIYCGDFVYGMLIGISDSTVYQISTAGGAHEIVRLTGLTGASGLTWDVANDMIYISTATQLFTIGPDDDVLEIGTYTSTIGMIGIASDLDGNLYGVDLADNFYMIDTETGVETVIGSLGIDINYAQDIGFDRNNGILYGTFYLGGGTGGLYTVDVATGAATQIGVNFGDELTMCAIYYDIPTYAVTFTVDDGTDPIDGAMIEIDGETYTATAGTVDIELEEGEYTYTVTANGFVDYNGTYTVTTDANQLEEVHMDGIYSVTFHVYDFDMSTDMEGALVTITDGPFGNTDVDGNITFTFDEGTEIEYWVSADGYVLSMGNHTVIEDITIEMPMFETTYSVTFTVTDGTDPIEGASVELTTAVKEIVLTDVDGIASFTVTAGFYDYTVTMDGYTSFTSITPVEVVDANVVVPTVELDIIDAINELNSNVNVYPNPSNGLFTVSVNGTYNLQVVDITGKVISEQEITNQEDINLSEAGIYMLRLTNDVETLNYKVIVK